MSKLIVLLPLIFLSFLSIQKYNEDILCQKYDKWPERNEWESWNRKFWTCKETLELSIEERECLFEGEECKSEVENKEECALPLSEEEQKNCLMYSNLIKDVQPLEALKLNYSLCSSGSKKYNRLSCYLLYDENIEIDDDFLMDVCNNYKLLSLCRYYSLYKLSEDNSREEFRELLKRSCNENDKKSCEYLFYLEQVEL